MPKQRAAAISNAQKASAAAGLAIPPHGPNALFNQPGVGRARRRRKRYKALNWGAQGGQTIGGALGRDATGRFSNSGGPSARQANTAAQRARREAMRAKRQARADARVVAREAELAQEETTRADEDSYIAAGKTGKERQQRRAEVATARRERAATRREARRQEAITERGLREQEDEEEAKTRESEAAKGGGGGGGGGKKKPSDDEKTAEQEKKRAATRTATAPKAGLSTAEANFLAGAALGTLPPGSFDANRLMQLGLVADAGDTTEATDAGRRALAAMERGDVREALAAIQDGKARVARERAGSDRRRQRGEDKKKRDAERAKREQARRAEQAKRTHERQQREDEKKRRADEKKRDQMEREADRRARLREGSPKLAAQIIRNITERRQRRRRKETYGGTPRGKLRESVFAGPDRSFPIVTAQDVRDAVRSLGRTKHDKAVVKRGIIRRARAIGAMDALPDRWREKGAGSVRQSPKRVCLPSLPAVDSIAPSLIVFKDAHGVDRWAAITTTAYQDKDQEWISCKAIRAVVAAGDASGERGPLRFWHVPGLDLGDCDYQAALDGGRLLLESGTFRSKAAARIGQKAAQLGYQMSPGFLHTRKEPRGGIFDHIALFERSFVPPGRASNPYTRLLTKEVRMLTDEKRKEFEALAGDDEGRALLQSLLATAQATTKAADEAGAVYKDAPAWATALIGRIDALEATVKAPMPPVEMEEAGATEEADGLAELDADLGLGDEPVDEGMDDGAFADMIVEKLVAALGPMLELEKKMTGYLGEMKTMLQPSPAMQQKDDARVKAVEAIDARLKELEGGQPRSMNVSAWHQLTGIPVTKEQAQAITAKQANEVPAGLSEQEQGAYTLIFGDQ